MRNKVFTEGSALREDDRDGGFSRDRAGGAYSAVQGRHRGALAYGEPLHSCAVSAYGVCGSGRVQKGSCEGRYEHLRRIACPYKLFYRNGRASVQVFVLSGQRKMVGACACGPCGSFGEGVYFICKTERRPDISIGAQSAK